MDFEEADLDPTRLRSSRRLSIRRELARAAEQEPELLRDLGHQTPPLPMVPRVTPHATTEEMLAAVQDIVRVPLPPALAAQAITHETWQCGTGFAGHNRRLAFIGRKALKMLLSTFLHAQLPAAHLSDPIASQYREEVSQLLHEPNESLSSTWFTVTDAQRPKDMPPARPYDVLLHTYHLGGSVGELMHLERVMRWSLKVLNPRLRDTIFETYPRVQEYEERVRAQGSPDGIPLPEGPFLPGWAYRPASIGEARKTWFWLVRGAAVEAIVGAVYHQHGMATTQALFHAKILPGLVARGSMPLRGKGSKNAYNDLPLEQYPVRWPRVAGPWDDIAAQVQANTPAALEHLESLAQQALTSPAQSASTQARLAA